MLAHIKVDQTRLNQADTLHQEALTFEVGRHYAKAQNCYQRELALRESVDGAKCTTLLEALSGLACVLEAQGLLADAEAHRRRMLEIEECNFAKNSATVLLDLDLLVDNLIEQRRQPEARRLAYRSYRERSSTGQEGDQELAYSLLNCARLHQLSSAACGQSWRRLQKAERFLRRALRLLERTKSSYLQVRVLTAYAELKRSNGHRSAARDLFASARKVLAAAPKLLLCHGVGLKPFRN